MATMELEPTFKFIDVSKAKSDDAVKYEIRVRAAFHGYKHAHRIHPVSGRRIGPRIVKRTGKARNKKQASRRDNHAHDQGEAARTESFPLESLLLVPYTWPLDLRNQNWLDAVLKSYFDFHLPFIWAMFNLEALLRFPVDVFVNWIRFHAMNDPAIYCINACAAAFNCLPKGQKSAGRFFWIKSHVLQEVNTALSDSQRSCQSLTMVAVLLLATYEAFGGNARISREVHVPGIIGLLALQGGEREFSKSIPAPIMLHLRWCSDALARSCGTEPIFSPLGVEVGDVMGSIKGSVTESLGDEVYGDENQYRTSSAMSEHEV